MKICLECNNDITSKRGNKFCSRSCASSYNNRKYPKRKKSDKPAIKNKTCDWCGEKYSGPAKYFCSIQCNADAVRAANLNRWMAFHEDWRGIKDYILDYQNGKCNICGIHEWNGKILVLQLEHVDGNSDNNRRDNLEVICPNCHSQTSTYGAKNKGVGTHTKRMISYRNRRNLPD